MTITSEPPCAFIRGIKLNSLSRGTTLFTAKPPLGPCSWETVGVFIDGITLHICSSMPSSMLNSIITFWCASSTDFTKVTSISTVVNKKMRFCRCTDTNIFSFGNRDFVGALPKLGVYVHACSRVEKFIKWTKSICF